MTSVYGGGSYPKDNIRIEAYGTVDETNSIVGCVLGFLKGDLGKPLLEVQKELFMVGAELATLNPSPEMSKGFVQESHIKVLETQIDDWETSLEPLKKFILPGGSQAASFLHLARTTCRRAERQVVSLSHQDPLRPELIQYLNRLSDWFFVLARAVNKSEGITDILWEGLLKS